MLTSSSIKLKALELGFDLCGVSAAERHPKLDRLAEWIAQGRSGDMVYLSKSLEERLDPRRVLPGARTVVSLGVVYNTDQPYSSALSELGRVAVARYAWGDDYHDVLRERLRALVQWMADSSPAGFEAFSNVDNGPVQERVFAEQAGLGWIGKNTCLINPTLGSWIFLAEVLTNVPLEVDSPAVDQCGTCTRCLDACPTGAIVEAYHVDATRCLSYVTIEQRASVADDLRPGVERQVYGCDICQDVCPWNRRAAVSEEPAWRPRPGLAFPRLVDLCALADEDWSALLKGSAMRRAGLTRLRRSLAYAAAHLSAIDGRRALESLAAHPSGARAEVAEAIEWARRRIDAECEA